MLNNFVFYFFIVPLVFSQRSFIIDYQKNCFLKDGECFRYISGGLHYFRIPSIYWDDRLKKAKALGLNAIQTYIAWNIHEEIQGDYDFTGERDVIRFIDLAQKNGLLVILRPGPYIDAEWEHGGLPWWLAKDPKIGIRNSNGKYFMQNVTNWFNELFQKLKPKLYKNGGPIIAFQIENEYGNYYSCDRLYLSKLKGLFHEALGEDVVFFTTDGYTDNYLKCGTSSSIFTTIDFGTEISATDAFKQLRKYQKNGPLVNSEYYTGWLDYWGHKHETCDGKKIAKYLDQMLSLNASMNLYMFHGGTNFKFYNGADLDNALTFSISPTSYDYDAPLSEAGDITLKYNEIRTVLQKYNSQRLPPIPSNTSKMAYGYVDMSLLVGIFDVLPLLPFTEAEIPLSMEKVDQAYGYILYKANIPQIYNNVYLNLTVDMVHDRSIIFIDKKRCAVVERGYVELSIPYGLSLEIFVENQGRLAYAPKPVQYLPDPKGIIGDVKVEGNVIRKWKMYTLDDYNLNGISWLIMQNKYISSSLPTTNWQQLAMFYGKFSAVKVADTFLSMGKWNKGQVYINGFNIGRYWQAKGPQKTLFVPKSFLKPGRNVVIVLELDKAPCTSDSRANCSISFVDQPDLGKKTQNDVTG